MTARFWGWMERGLGRGPSGRGPIFGSRNFNWAIVAAHAVALVLIALHRPIDADEGYYASAAQLVAEGQLPYRDFFFPQAPLFPIAYAPLARLFPGTLLGLRLGSVCFAIGSAVLVLRLLESRPMKARLRPLLLLLYAANPGVLAWNATAKSYALASFLLVAALFFLERNRGKLLSLFVAGVLLGLATSTRLLYVAPMVGLAVAVGLADRRWLAATLAGGLVGIVPLLASASVDLEAALFGNVGYHQLRATPPDFIRRVGSALLFLVRTAWRAPFAAGALVLGGLASVHTLWRRVRQRPIAEAQGAELYGATAFLALLFVSFAPWPLYPQYLEAPLAPLAIVASASGVWKHLPIAKRGLDRVVSEGRPIRAACMWATAIAALGLMLTPRRIFANSQEPVWSLESYRQTVAAIARHSSPGDAVLSLWPGYVFGAQRRHVSGFENHFAMRVSPKVSKGNQHRLHLGSPQRFVEAVREQQTSLVVFGGWHKDFLRGARRADARALEELFDTEYQLEHRSGTVRVLRSRGEGLRANPRSAEGPLPQAIGGPNPARDRGGF